MAAASLYCKGKRWFFFKRYTIGTFVGAITLLVTFAGMIAFGTASSHSFENGELSQADTLVENAVMPDTADPVSQPDDETSNLPEEAYEPYENTINAIDDGSDADVKPEEYLDELEQSGETSMTITIP